MMSWTNPFPRRTDSFEDDEDEHGDNCNNDAAVLQTAQDALETKWAAVQAGYYDDAFVNSMIMNSSLQRKQRHVQPLIKRGTHARVCCMERALSAFVQAAVAQSNGTRLVTVAQIVVLGAGLDTGYFRWFEQQQNNCGEQTQKIELIWFEIDHAVLCQEKATIIEKQSIFSAHRVTKIGNDAFRISAKDDYNHKSSCTLLGHDLRDSGLVEKLLRQGAEPNIPTLILSECVQMYLPVQKSKDLMSSLVSGLMADVIFCSYEPILGSTNSQFGVVMERNMKRAGLAASSSGLIQNRTLQQHLKHARDAGLSRGVACSLWAAYTSILTPQQRQRANASEFLDELEEWSMIMQHYAFVMATTANSNTGKLLVVSPMEASSLVGFPKVGSEYHAE